MPLFSIIIPVYKVENYLLKCVNSVLDQNFNDIEVILVDDGSPDDCPSICDQLAHKDTRIKVIHKENGGLSDARNFGIKAAKGKYILFLDSDDYWEGADCLRGLVNTINRNHADVTMFGTKDVNLVTNTEVFSRGWYAIEAIQKDKDAAIKSLFETGHFPGSAWVLAIKRSFLLENNLFFIVGIKAEDIDWLTHVFVKANTFDAVNDSFYMYIKNRPGSITNTADLKSAKDILFSVAKWHTILRCDLTPYNRFLLSYLAYQYLTSYIIFSKLNKTDRKILLPIIQKEKSILHYLYGKKGQFGRASVRLLGIKYSAHLFRYIHELNHKWANLKQKLV
jgi:glycosyltransferase involved in cell wall biosynthesis